MPVNAADIVNDINDSIYGRVEDASLDGELNTGFHRHAAQSRGDGTVASVACGREAAIALPFLSADIRKELKESLDAEKAEMWQGFAEQWNKDNPGHPVKPGDGRDWRKASAAMSEFRKKNEDNYEINDEFSYSCSEVMNGWFMDEHQACDIEIAASPDDNGGLEISLSFNSRELYSATVPAAGLRDSDIDAIGEKFLSDAAKAARKRKSSPAPR